MKYRAERILKECNIEKHVVVHIIRTVANDFPPFRTAEKPNEWERGYHTVLSTLHDIVDEIESL